MGSKSSCIRMGYRMQSPCSAVNDVMDVSSGIQSEAERTFPGARSGRHHPPERMPAAGNSTRANAKCPAGQLAVDLVRHVGELDAGSTAIGQKHSFSRFPLFGDVTYTTLQRFRIKARILILKCGNVGRFAKSSSKAS